MTGKNIGFKSFFQAAQYDHITFTHCLIHREALATKKLASELNDVLQDAVKIINFIKSHALNSRLFSNLCKDTDSNYTTLLSHAEVRWLSRGQSLRRLLLLKDEIEIFLTERKCELAAFFQNDLWLSKLCYLSDIFAKLNDLNLSLQRKNCDIFASNDKIETLSVLAVHFKLFSEVPVVCCLRLGIFRRRYKNTTDVHVAHHWGLPGVL